MSEQAAPIIYRGTTLGCCLMEVLEEMVAKDEISSQISANIKEQFDEVQNFRKRFFEFLEFQQGHRQGENQGKFQILSDLSIPMFVFIPLNSS